MYAELAMYIDGEWCQGSDGAGEDVINPATEETLARLPHASAADLDRALAAAARGFAQWRATSAYDRGAILYKAGDLIRERAGYAARDDTPVSAPSRGHAGAQDCRGPRRPVW